MIINTMFLDSKIKTKFKLSYTQIIALGFLLIILIGALLLSLPIASKAGQATAFIDSFFTAASATCVTGLIVFDTYTYWSIFGQLVILVLIQIGGLGFMAVAMFFSLLLRRRIGLKERTIMQASINTLSVGGIVRMARHMLWGTFLVELVGAVLLAFRFCPLLGLKEGVYYAVFHSVSAFCNAGFDLMGRYETFSSLTLFANDLVVNLVICGLIIIGGIGFMVWEDVITHGIHFQKYKLHSKMALLITAGLILIPAGLIACFEYGHSFAGMSLAESSLAALFQAVSPRTAGFNTVDLTTLTDATVLLIIFLMIVGGSSGSTAGGIKTTTFGVLIFSTIANIRKSHNVNVLGRRLDEDCLRRAGAVLICYLGTGFLAVMVICFLDQMGMKVVLFEVFSAMSTVGLSLGITAELGTPAKLILAFLMYFGRVGILSMALALAEPRKAPPIQHPLERIMIG